MAESKKYDKEYKVQAVKLAEEVQMLRKKVKEQQKEITRLHRNHV